MYPDEHIARAAVATCWHVRVGNTGRPVQDGECGPGVSRCLGLAIACFRESTCDGGTKLLDTFVVNLGVFEWSCAGRDLALSVGQDTDVAKVLIVHGQVPDDALEVSRSEGDHACGPKCCRRGTKVGLSKSALTQHVLESWPLSASTIIWLVIVVTPSDFDSVAAVRHAGFAAREHDVERSAAATGDAAWFVRDECVEDQATG